MSAAHVIAAAAVRAAGRISPGWGSAIALPLFGSVAAPHPIDPADRETMWRAERSTVRIPGVDRRGRDLAVYEWGRPDGDVIALAHGWNGRASQFATLVRELVSEGYRVVAFDAPAHGDSVGRGTYLLDWVAALGELQERHGRLTAVIGHSFGGLATLLAAAQGIAVDRVVTVAAPADADLLLSQFQKQAGLRRPDGGRASRAIRAPLLPRRRRSVRRFCRRCGILFRAATRLLVVHDESDRVVPFREAARIVGANAGAVSLVTRDLGHSRILRADPFLDAVLDFLATTMTRTDAPPVGEVPAPRSGSTRSRSRAEPTRRSEQPRVFLAARPRDVVTNAGAPSREPGHRRCRAAHRPRPVRRVRARAAAGAPASRATCGTASARSARRARVETEVRRHQFGMLAPRATA